MSTTSQQHPLVQSPGSRPPEVVIGARGVVYEIVMKLGRGGMAETFLAQQRGPGRAGFIFCLKRMGVGAHKREFLDEAYITSLLHHDCIVRALGIDQDEDKRWFLCMEYVEGVDLRHLLNYYEQRDERIPVPLTTYIVDRVLQALAYAHELRDAHGPLKIVHRDVNPSNILLGRFGSVKLTDFGIARFREKESYTAEGCVKGKLRYLAPEQCHAGVELDARTDLYGVGATWFEMLTGMHPYGERNHDVSVIDALVRGRLNPLRELAPEVDPRILDLVLRLVQHDRDKRPSSAREVLEEIRALGPRLDLSSELSGPVRACLKERIADPPGEYDGLHTLACGLIADPMRGFTLDSAMIEEACAEAWAAQETERATGNREPIDDELADLASASEPQPSRPPSAARMRGVAIAAPLLLGATVGLAGWAVSRTPGAVAARESGSAAPRVSSALPDAATVGPVAGGRTMPSEASETASSAPVASPPVAPVEEVSTEAPAPRAPKPAAAPGPRKTGSLVVVVRAAKAAIWVNGVLQPSRRPLSLPNLTPGLYRIDVSEDESVPARVHAKVRIVSGKESRITLDLPTSF